LQNLKKIRYTNGTGPVTLPVDNKKRDSVINSKGKSPKSAKFSNIWCHYYENNNHNHNNNTADCRALAKFKQQKKDRFEAKAVSGKSL
jgi:hypothetical protein